MRASATVYPALARYLGALVAHAEELPPVRRGALDRIAAFVRAQRDAGAAARLLFVCTGNSRRSHLAQVWAAAAARLHGIDGVESFSGGTVPSAFNPRTRAAVERAGFVVEGPDTAGENPRYRIRYADDAAAIEAFSKRCDDAVNPQADFAAVMTCSAADEACPVVPGAAIRVSLPYDDPAVADDTPHEAARYDERARQIATEMLYLFSRVATS